MSDWQRRSGVRIPQRPNIGLTNDERRARYEAANESINRRALTPRQAKRIALKRGSETARNARRRWRRRKQ